jgi:hypothetical protein
MFVIKARVTEVKLVAITANIGLGREGLRRTNTQAYNEH